MRVSENRVLRKIFGPKMEEVAKKKKTKALDEIMRRMTSGNKDRHSALGFKKNKNTF
jgi:hypothetical protein